jgi:hypothetical protein
VGVHALGPDTTVESLGKGVVGRLARPGEVEDDTTGIGPQIEITADELAALIHPDGLGIADIPTVTPSGRRKLTFSGSKSPH